MKREEQIDIAFKELGIAYNAALRTLFGIGVQWADSHPNWISVEERLPVEEDLYITSDGNAVSVGYWVEGHWDIDEDKITYWMPLPTPPRKE